MKVLDSIKNLKFAKSSKESPCSVATIGNFDGVHLGHRALIQTLVQEARTNNLPSVVLTFDPHPVQVLYPNRKLQRIFSREDQISELQNLGVDNLVIEPFTLALSQLPAEQFLKECVFNYLHPKLLIVGYDFSFGANRSGSIPQLLEFAKAWGFELMIIPPQKVAGEVVSSSLVRSCVLKGEMQKVQQLLDRPFYLSGPIIKGDQRGRTLGFATANLATRAELLPPHGVYLTRSHLAGKSWPSVTNVGSNPTFEGARKTRIETHILDFDEHIYGETLKVEFFQKIRNEEKFGSVDDLKKQIIKDIITAREYFAL